MFCVIRVKPGQETYQIVNNTYTTIDRALDSIVSNGNIQFRYDDPAGRSSYAVVSDCSGSSLFIIQVPIPELAHKYLTALSKDDPVLYSKTLLGLRLDGKIDALRRLRQIVRRSRMLVVRPYTRHF